MELGGYPKAIRFVWLDMLHTNSTQIPYQFHTNSTPIPHKFHTNSTPIPHQFHTNSIPIPYLIRYLVHTYPIPIPYIFHTHIFNAYSIHNQEPREAQESQQSQESSPASLEYTWKMYLTLGDERLSKWTHQEENREGPLPCKMLVNACP